MRRLIGFGVAIVGVALLFSIPDATQAQGTTTLQHVSEVPVSVPLAGVEVNQEFILKPLSVPVLLSKAQAVAIAERYSNTAPRPPVAVLANVTVPDSLAPAGAGGPWKSVNAEPSWVVTFTWPSAFNVNMSPEGSPMWVTHMTLVINANTGAFVRGFFEP